MSTERILSLLYALVFFMAGIVPALVFPVDRARFFGSILRWGPSLAGIGVALAVTGVIRSDRVPLPLRRRIRFCGHRPGLARAR